MGYMFYNAKFNGNIAAWNVSEVLDMSYMFYGGFFNHDIQYWNIQSTTSIEGFFDYQRWNDFEKPTAYHWLLASTHSDILEQYPQDWKEHFNTHISIAQGVTSSPHEAAMLLYTIWKTTDKSEKLDFDFCMDDI